MTEDTIWENGRCKLCGYVPKMGNRRTPSSRRNWLRYAMERHEKKHAKEPANGSTHTYTEWHQDGELQN